MLNEDGLRTIRGFLQVVFLSYRRGDTGDLVGRLADNLKTKLGKRWVFRDIGGIPPSALFDVKLKRELQRATTVLVLIGPDWLSELERRLTLPDVDYLRLEVTTALSRRKQVIPILWKGASMPASRDLPEDMKPLARYEALTMRDDTFESDLDRLVEAIGPYCWRCFFIRTAVSVAATVAAVRMLFPDVSMDRARWLILSSLAAYLLLELGHRFYRVRERNALHSGAPLAQK